MFIEEGIYEFIVIDVNGCIYELFVVNVGIMFVFFVDIWVIDYDEYGQVVVYFYESYSICQGENVFFEVFNSELYFGYFYIWSMSQNGLVIEFFEDKDNLFDVGNYIFEVIVVDGVMGCLVVVILEVVVYLLFYVLVILVDQFVLICEGMMVILFVDVLMFGLIYVWSIGEMGMVIEVLEGGEYIVMAINIEGCIQVSEVFELFFGLDIVCVLNGCYI